MARRPVFLPTRNPADLVEERSFDIPWAPGFAPVQKRKNVASLHAAAAVQDLAPLLEISTKSEEALGRSLSAFNLTLDVGGGAVPLECAFQAGKVFERGGPFPDLLGLDARAAKRDPRLRSSGDLLGFRSAGHAFPLVPRTAFYDWLYLHALQPDRDALFRRLTGAAGGTGYAGFTDIEFNPKKSINCQARSCALFVSLMDLGLLDEVLRSPDAFVGAMRGTFRGA